MDNESDLKQAVLEKLEKNGTLNRIQAELRAAIFLAIEEDPKNEEPDSTIKSCPVECALVYHFLRQNKFPASAAVFEKEVNGKLLSLDEVQNETRDDNKLRSIFSTLVSTGITQKNTRNVTPVLNISTLSQHALTAVQKIEEQNSEESVATSAIRTNVKTLNKEHAVNSANGLDLREVDDDEKAGLKTSSEESKNQVNLLDDLLPPIKPSNRLPSLNAPTSSRKPFQANTFAKHLNDLLKDDESEKTSGNEDEIEEEIMVDDLLQSSGDESFSF